MGDEMWGQKGLLGDDATPEFPTVEDFRRMGPRATWRWHVESGIAAKLEAAIAEHTTAAGAAQSAPEENSAVPPGGGYHRSDCPTCHAAWEAALSDPAFVSALNAALDMETHHHFYKWSEVKAEKQGGPRPKCTTCGEEAGS